MNYGCFGRDEQEKKWTIPKKMSNIDGEKCEQNSEKCEENSNRFDRIKPCANLCV